MDHKDHVNLLKPANLSSGGTWADFGAGSGAFTLALRELLGRDQAMKLAMTAEEISGVRAVELGLATAVSDDPLAAAMDFALQLAARPPGTANAVKRLYRKSWTGTAGAALARESLYQIRILARRS